MTYLQSIKQRKGHEKVHETSISCKTVKDLSYKDDKVKGQYVRYIALVLETQTYQYPWMKSIV